MDRPLVSVTIPCYNPNRWVFGAIESVRRQTYTNWEILVVDDGTDTDEGKAVLAEVESCGFPKLRVLRHENRGLAAARNTGFRAANGEYLVPLDADDELAPQMMEASLAALAEDPGAAFTYSDYEVFGNKNYIERPGPYNLYRLLDRNYLIYCCCFRREAWELAGGYDEKYRKGYEDWNYLHQLAEKDLFGHYIPKTLFRYRKHGRSLLTLAREHHDEIVAEIRSDHPALYSPEGRLAVKRRWQPSVCFVVQGKETPDLSNQTLKDFEILQNVSEREALERSQANAFLWLTGGGEVRAQAAEECLLGLQHADWVTWRDTGSAPPPSLHNFAGPIGVSPAVMGSGEPKRSGEVRQLPWRLRTFRTRQDQQRAERIPAGTAAQSTSSSGANDPGGARLAFPALPSPLSRIHRHLQNAELLSRQAWLRHPLQSFVRLIPLRLKESVNRRAGREIFDLSFYLRFQPRSVLMGGQVVEPLDYIVSPPGQKRRVGVVTPHLGPGGAETVLLEFVRQFNRAETELLLITTHPGSRELEAYWSHVTDYLFRLADLVPAEEAPQVLFSLAHNWNLDALVIQNSLPAYRALPALREKHPGLRTLDFLHTVDEDWDFFSATLDVAGHLDRRIVISQAGRERLVEMNYPGEQIRLIPNGVDLEHFTRTKPQQRRIRLAGVPSGAKIVLYVGRLDEVKRPLLLVEAAKELLRTVPDSPAHFVVAGSGPEEEALHRRVQSKGLDGHFSLLGHVEAILPLMEAASVLVITSRGEGVPLVLLEALAMEIPVVACRAGAIEEALPPECGLLVEPGEYEAERLADALNGLLADDSRRAEMGRAGRKLVEGRHSLERARASYQDVIRELIPPLERVGESSGS